MVAVFSTNMTLQSFGYEAEEQIKTGNTKGSLVFFDFVRKIFCAGSNVSIITYMIRNYQALKINTRVARTKKQEDSVSKSHHDTNITWFRW